MFIKKIIPNNGVKINIICHYEQLAGRYNSLRG